MQNPSVHPSIHLPVQDSKRFDTAIGQMSEMREAVERDLTQVENEIRLADRAPLGERPLLPASCGCFLRLPAAAAAAGATSTNRNVWQLQ